MSNTNLSVVLCNKGDMRLMEQPIPEPGPGEVQFAVGNCGVCGTDLHLWEEGNIGPFDLKYPYVLGHESSGTVTKLGEGVTKLKVGDRVAVDPIRPCGKCHQCKTGRYHLCEELMILGCVPPPAGSMCRYNVHLEDHCHKLPEHVSLEEGALIEPLSVAVHTCKRANLFPGKKVLICGSGTVGLACAMVAKVMGVTEVCIIDIKEERLEIAKKLGFNCTHLVDTKDGKVVAAEVAQILGDMPECALECSGTGAGVETAIYATKSGGVVVLCGIGGQYVTIPLSNASLRQIDLLGLCGHPHCYPIAIQMVASGLVDVKPLITHRFQLTAAIDAFEMLKMRKPDAIKMMLCCERKP